MQLVVVDPFKCRMWDMHDRLTEYISEESCRNEIQSVERHGQKTPALGRRLPKHDTHEIELIYGARRLFVAQYLNVPLTVELADIDNRDALLQMDRENRLRKDISPYERGMSYKNWLRKGHFRSQREIAEALGVSDATVCRLMRFAELPSVVVSAFRTPLDIKEGWAVALADLCRDQAKRELITARARAISSSGLVRDANAVFLQLTAADAQRRRFQREARDEVIRGAAGKPPIFRVRTRRTAIHIILPSTVNPQVLNATKDFLLRTIEALGT